MINPLQNKVQIPNMIRLFKRRLVSQEELDAMVVGLRAKDRNLGSLPFDWFDKELPKEKYAAFFEHICGILGSFARDVKSVSRQPVSIFTPHILKMEEKMGKALGIRVFAKYLGEGSCGKAFKMVLDGKKTRKYVIKVFHLGQRVYGHGKSKEIANAINYCHATKKSKHAQFFFGRIAGKKNHDGFLVTEFLSGKKGGIYSFGPRMEYNRFDLIDVANGTNQIKGKLFDFDDIERTYSCKKAEEIAKQLIDALKKGDVKKTKKIMQKYKNAAEYDEVILKILDDAPIDESIWARRNIIPDDYTFEQRQILKMLEMGLEQ